MNAVNAGNMNRKKNYVTELTALCFKGLVLSTLAVLWKTSMKGNTQCLGFSFDMKHTQSLSFIVPIFHKIILTFLDEMSSNYITLSFNCLTILEGK